MSKKILFFSKGQRIAIITLLSLIIIIIIADLTLSKWAPQPQSFYNESFQKEIEAFEEQIKIAKTKNETKFPKVAEPKQTHINEQTISYFHFDPNTLDSIGFISLGLKPWIVSNILKYRSKGGVFKTVSDFGKIYGIDNNLFATLQPFIQITKTKEELYKSEKEISNITIELNAADTTQLATIMKKSLAKRIIGYRKALGGFYSIEQLGEIYNITEKELNDIIPHITLDLSLIQQINVNKATVEQLKRHPYLNFYQAKATCELRKAKKHLSSIEDISILEEFSKSDITRITPYLNFKQ